MASKPEEPVVAAPPAEEKVEAAPATETATAPAPQDPVIEKTDASPAAPTEDLKNLSLAEKDAPPAETAAAAGAPVTAEPAEKTTASSGPTWPATPEDHPLTKLFAQIEELTKEAGHSEVYGITLSPSNEFQTKLILQKFLRANQGDLEKGKQQLLETLKWRKEFDPVKAAGETFEKERFEGLGWILQTEGVPESTNQKDVVTFNVYGAVKDNKKTFGDLDA